MIGIITFAQSKDYLGIDYLSPMQKLFLKVMYSGTEYNDRSLTKEEIELMEWGLDNPIREQIKTKIGNNFNRIYLFLGRRSGISLLNSICCLYETYKLLITENPQEKLGYMPFETLNIVVFSDSELQARHAMGEKTLRLALNSPFFQQYINVKSNSLKIHFLTDNDKKENNRRMIFSEELLKGSICIEMYKYYSSKYLKTPVVFCTSDNNVIINREEFKKTPQMMTGWATPEAYVLYKENLAEVNSLVFNASTSVMNPSIDKWYLETEKNRNPKNYGWMFEARFKEEPDAT